MAVIVVGDIDPAADRTADPEELRRVPEHVGGRAPRRGGSAARRDAVRRRCRIRNSGSSVSIIHKRPLQPLRTAADYRRLLVRSLLSQMWNARFGEMSRQAGRAVPERGRR